MKILSILALFILITSCGSSPSRRVHEKQRTPSDVQIDAFDFTNKKLELRFEYRTYVEKILTSMSCDLTLNKESSIKLIKDSQLELGAFSTEIISFDLNSQALPAMEKAKTIDYNIECTATYDKGTEYMQKHSVLHLVPTSQSRYR